MPRKANREDGEAGGALDGLLPLLLSLLLLVEMPPMWPLLLSKAAAEVMGIPQPRGKWLSYQWLAMDSRVVIQTSRPYDLA